MNVKDAVVIGAGPAGLSAALILGRCCRNVYVAGDASRAVQLVIVAAADGAEAAFAINTALIKEDLASAE